MLTFIITLIVFFLVIGLLVLVHEYGHYKVARAVGIKVEEFAIGMGPKVWGYKKDGIEFNLRAFPIGGYVKMYGEGDYDNKENNSFAGKPALPRLAVLLAGVTMNFLLAILLFSLQGANLDFKYRNPQNLDQGSITPIMGEKSKDYVALGNLQDGSPLKDKVYLLDTVIKVNGKEYTGYDQFRAIIDENKGKEISLEVLPYTSSQTKTVNVTPRTDNPAPLGVSIISMSFVEYQGFGKVVAGFGQAVNGVQNFVITISNIFGKAFQTNNYTPVVNSVGGAISIFEILKLLIITFGFWGIIELAAAFSINLAVFNLLPIPALDGGHVVFTLVEMISRRKLPAALYNYLTLGGFILLMGLTVFVTSLDLIKHTDVRNIFCPNDKKDGFICQTGDFRSK